MTANDEPADPQSNTALDVRPGFLTNHEFEEHWEKLLPATEESDRPPPQQHIGPASVDLHLGSEYYIAEMDAPAHLSDEKSYLAIPHGEFALLITREVLSIPPNLLGLMTMRMKYKGKGLINVSGFHVDPGFTGQFYFSVYNAGPRDIKLKWKEPVFTMFLATLAQEATPYEGDYKNQRGLPPHIVAELGGAPVNIVKLDERLKGLETQVTIFDFPGLSQRLEGLEAQGRLYGRIGLIAISLIIALIASGASAGIGFALFKAFGG